MVYRGKPSAACAECRKRRNRCDQGLPECGQCVKANRTCSGYRNTVDLMFFDESSSVVKKSRSRTGTPPETSPKGSSATSAPQRAKPVRLNHTVFYQPLDDLALNFFMSTYVGNDKMNSQFDYLPDFYSRYSSTHVKLQHSIRAIGLAGYAKATRRTDLLMPATKRYLSAIRGVNTALSSPIFAVEDATLACVLLLAMFEVMVMPKNLGLQNLTTHLNGAISVAALYIKHQQRSEFSMKLLETLSQSVIMNCWIQNIPLPAEFIELKEHLDPKASSSIHSKLLDIITVLIGFRHTSVTESYGSPSALVSQAVTLDNRLRSFTDDMPKEGQFQSVYKDLPSHLAFNGTYHIYPKNFTAHLFNNIRSTRIRLHNQIIAQCHEILASPLYAQPFNVGLATQLEVSGNLIRALAKEICATVPQLAGYLDQLQASSPRGPLPSQSLTETRSKEPIVQSAFTSPSNLPNDQSGSKPSPPTSTSSDPPEAVPSLPVPRPASLYHLLYQLRMLSAITILPESMKLWIQERIQWVEGNTDPDDLELLRAMTQNAPSGAFPFFVNI